MIIKDTPFSKIWLEDNLVYKQQPKFLTDNEIWILKELYPSSYVPLAEQVSIDTIQMEYIKPTVITNLDIVRRHFDAILIVLRNYGIRHGDLTDANILIRGNHPYIIDWSESRLSCDPRPDKRPESDKYWLRKTFNELSIT